ncbi:hypothetical protein GCM10022287_26970 [Gryllotalpicola koreensis]|uniref:Type 4 fimbrial biogenesis protein PilX N-terminal domain-containing protein n=2 Tax=Gryllotalpicola koreensis TaxID=993086 RepID=A0ABP8A4M3_9MICO
MVAVLSVMAVIMVVVALIGAVTVQSLRFTGSTKNSVQAQASAETGIDVAASLLTQGTCTSATFTQPTSASDPNYLAGASYSVAIAWSPAATGDSAWTSGCPTAAALRVKLTSTGLAGPGMSSKRIVEAIYAAHSTTTTAPNSSLTPSGPAIYAYSATGFSGSGTLSPVSGSVPSVRIRNGDVNCTGGSNVQGDLIAATGNLTVGGSCNVGGSVWTPQTLTITGSLKVGGDATAKSMNLAGTHVSGNAWTSNDMTLQWGTQVDQNATAKILNLSGGNVLGTAWSQTSATYAGGATIGGNLVAQSTNSTSSAAKGTKIVAAGPGPGPSAPATPTVPNWIDYAYSASDWPGFTVVTLPAGSCDWTTFYNADISLGGSKGIIDARNCTGTITISTARDKLPVNNDLVILGKSFDLGASFGFTATSAHRLWLITPDTTMNGQPDCPGSNGAGTFTVEGGATLDPHISVMIYSPCFVNITSGIDWYGQVFAGEVQVNGSANLHFVSVGLPGYNLDTGTALPPTVTSSPSVITSRQSIRNIAG